MTLQSDADFQRHLDEQVGFIVASARAYDDGVGAEAKRLAVAIRTLVHDTERSTSLLAQLGMKADFFRDSAAERPPEIASSYAGLVGVRVDPGPPRYVPSFDTWPSRAVPFEEWWTQVVIADLNRREITRKRLVLAAANRDGGAHVDRELDEVYAELSRANSMGMAHTRGGPTGQPVLGVDHASIRQVAHELLGSLGRKQPQPLSTGREVTIHSPTTSVSLGRSSLVLTRVGRNDPCPCGSGKKYKKCHAA